MSTPDQDPRLEAILADYARRQPTPPGLADRVYQASVRLLPQRRSRRAVIHRLEPVRASWMWGRLALAASVALAFVVAVRVAQPPEPMSPELELALMEYAGEPGLELVVDFEDPGFSTMESVLVTRDMTFADLAGELDKIARDM